MMLAFSRKRAAISSDNFDTNAVLDELAKAGFQPLIRSLKNELLSRLGLTPDKETEEMLKGVITCDLLAGDVFFPNDSSCCYLKVEGEIGGEEVASNEVDVFSDPGMEEKCVSGMFIEVGEISPITGNEGEKLEDMIDAINAKVKKLKWEDVESTATTKLKGRSLATPQERDIELAGILRDERLQPVLAKLKSEKSLVADEYLSSIEDAEEIEYFIDKLLELDFLNEEVVIFDADTKQPIIRAQDRAAVEQLAKAGIRSMSGKPISDADIKRLVAVNHDKAHQMTDAWAAKIFLANSLLKVGLSNQDIHELEATDNGSLVYCLFDGLPLVFMLANNFKDNGLAEALKVNIEQLKEARVVVFCENGCPKQISDYLTNSKSVKELVEVTKLDELNAQLAMVFENMRNKAVADVLQEINLIVSFDIGGLVFKRIAGMS